MIFYIVDAFTDKIFGGNPAGVVLLDHKDAFPDSTIMKKTAAELRYSETAFVNQLSDQEFQIRYFTPIDEVDLCGHATIGSFYAMLFSGIVRNDTTYTCHTLAGSLHISIINNFIMMEMGAPELLGKIQTEKDLKELYSIMGLDYETSYMPLAASSHLPLLPEIISTGLPDIIMPVKTRADLARIDPDFQRLSQLSERYNVVGVHAFAQGDSQITAYCRNFAPLYGINEEAATGTSNGALTHFLYNHGLIKEGNLNSMIQGEAMNRPSSIITQISRGKIQVGGTGAVLAKGEIFL